MQGKRTKRYCSNKCIQEARRRRDREARGTTKCVRCSAPLTKPHSKLYCSNECMVSARNERSRLKGRTPEEYAEDLAKRAQEREDRKAETRKRERTRRRERYHADPSIRERINQWNRDHKEQRSARARERHQQLRSMVFDAYGGPSCACCGENHRQFLAIDHVDGGGAEHRRQLRAQGISVGSGFYKWLRDHDFPPGFRVLCHNCNSALGFYGFCPHQETEAENLSRKSA
jgi:hypothetical protein